jgi:aspartyl-tRNA(Asn)/glutamyl-tRNA(Gln) amidotransferase subunit B
MRLLNDSGLTAGELNLTPAYLAEIIQLVDGGVVNTNTGKSLLEKVNRSGQSPKEIVEAEGLAKVSDDSALRAAAEAIVAENPKEVESYKSGKVGLIGWFVGQLMRKDGRQSRCPQSPRDF